MSSSDLTREQIIDLLYYLGASKVVNRSSSNDIQFTCTVHNESRPSAGVSVDKQIYNCFSCGSTGTLDWLVYQSNPDDFRSIQQARKFLEDRYNISYEKEDTKIRSRILRFGETEEQEHTEERKVLPRKTLAPFKSGKETFKYFYDRGFNKKALIEFEVGRDLVNDTVTVPIRYEDNELCGVVGRFIDPNREKHERYMVYEFKRGKVTFPQNKLEVIDDTIILVEDVFDAINLYMLGLKNVQAIMGDRVTKDQAEFLKSKATKFVRFFDNDKGGEQAKEMYKKVMTGVTSYDVVYPEGVNDPCELNREQIEYMLKNKKSPMKLKLKRL